MYHQPPQNDDEDIVTISVKGAELHGTTELLRQLVAQFELLTVSGESFSQGGTVSKAQLRSRALRIAHARRARTDAFNKSMFGEPAWDMLLELFINHDFGVRHSVGKLCELSGSPPTTALRWLDYLEKERLVSRHPHPTDRRTEFVELTEKGCTAMARYLSGTPDSFS